LLNIDTEGWCAFNAIGGRQNTTAEFLAPPMAVIPVAELADRS
jgi:hypothetical protein